MGTTVDVVIPLNPIGPTSVARKLEVGEDLNLLEKITVTDRINRVWRRHLSPRELSAALYIAGRTTSYGRGSFTATYKNISEGKGDFCGIGFAESTTREVFKVLADKGVILREKRPYDVRITLNVEWPEKTTMSLPIPERLRTRPQRPAEDDQWGQSARNPAFQSAGNPATNTSNEKSGSKKKRYPSPVADAPASGRTTSGGVSGEEGSGDEECTRVQPAETCAQTFAASHEQLVAASRDKAQKAITKKRVSTVDVERIWRAALAETFPEVMHVGWTKEQQGALAASLKRWNAHNTVGFGELVDWAVRNWTQLMASPAFNWMEGRPAAPDLRFFTSAKLSSRLASAMMSDVLNRFSNGTDGDRVRRYMAKGLTREEAIRQIGRDDAVAQERQDRLRTEAEAKRKLAEANEKLKRAERLDGLAEKLAEGNLDGVSVAPKRFEGQTWGHGLQVRHPNSPAAKAAAAEEARWKYGASSDPFHSMSNEEYERRLKAAEENRKTQNANG